VTLVIGAAFPRQLRLKLVHCPAKSGPVPLQVAKIAKAWDGGWDELLVF
jgi:hypothetical protein